MKTFRRLAICITGLALSCGPEPVCIDAEDNELPFCLYGADELEYCPGDSWGVGDGCNSCGCDDDGIVVCTEIPCGA